MKSRTIVKKIDDLYDLMQGLLELSKEQKNRDHMRVYLDMMKNLKAVREYAVLHGPKETEEPPKELE